MGTAPHDLLGPRAWHGKALRRLLVVGSVVAVMVGCGDDDGNGGPRTATHPVDASTSVPFSIDAPDGFELVTAGRGNTLQAWGEDCCGTHEPYTVLSPDGSADGDGVVVVTTTGFAGQQGGLAQSNRGYIQRGLEELTVDGLPALFHPGGRVEGRDAPLWADLTVQRGDDVAVGVGAESRTREAMLEVAEATEVPDDRLEAPSVDDPPGGLEVVGSVDADVHVALASRIEPGSDHVPGSERSHAIAWRKDRTDIVALSLPPDSVDVAALLAHDLANSHWTRAEVGLIEIDDHPAASLELPSSEPRRAVLVDRPWGPVVVVASGEGAPHLDDLAALAATAEPIEAAAWEEFVVEATGGPGLNPDGDRTELARGEENGIEWLLQTAPGGDGEGPPGYDQNLDPIDPAGRADPCLKLSTRKRACAAGGGGSGGTWIGVAESPDELNGLPPFSVITTDIEGTRLRVTVGDRSATGLLHELPGGERWGGVVFIDPQGAYVSTALCAPRPDGMSGPEVRIDVLDDAGDAVGCVSTLEAVIGGG